MGYRTLNEDRGARRAADLKRRFRHVSDTSFGPRRSFVPSASGARNPNVSSIGRTRFNTFAVWATMAVIVLFVSSILL